MQNNNSITLVVSTTDRDQLFQSAVESVLTQTVLHTKVIVDRDRLYYENIAEATSAETIYPYKKK